MCPVCGAIDSSTHMWEEQQGASSRRNSTLWSVRCCAIEEEKMKSVLRRISGNCLENNFIFVSDSNYKNTKITKKTKKVICILRLSLGFRSLYLDADSVLFGVCYIGLI